MYGATTCLVVVLLFMESIVCNPLTGHARVVRVKGGRAGQNVQWTQRTVATATTTAATQTTSMSLGVCGVRVGSCGVCPVMGPHACICTVHSLLLLVYVVCCMDVACVCNHRGVRVHVESLASWCVSVVVLAAGLAWQQCNIILHDHAFVRGLVAC